MTRNDIAKSLKPERWLCNPFEETEYCKLTDIHEAILRVSMRSGYVVEIRKEGSAIPLWMDAGGITELKESVRRWRVDHYSESFSIDLTTGQ